jgi:two-component system sensor histidine kinase/response regulator
MKPENYTLLVVDDTLETLQLIALRLRADGYKVATALDGRHALAILDEQKIDCVLLDIMMPHMDGFEVLQLVRQKYSLSDLPVIMTTALGESEDIVKALQLGANDYITKPIDVPVMLARIGTQLRLRELALLREEFVRVASHDLKNPLFSILLSIQMVEELVPVSTQMTPQANNLLSLVVRQIAEMQRIIDEFLDFQAIEDGKLVLRHEKLQLNQLVHEVVNLNLEYASRKGQAISLELEEPMPEVWADRRRISQVISNILGNAIKFSPNGPSKIILRTRAGEQAVMFEVSDQGPGLAEADLPQVFNKYNHLSNLPTGGEKSSGLGLAISRQMIELHGGEIGVRNNSGKGSTFWFSLPI